VLHFYRSKHTSYHRISKTQEKTFYHKKNALTGQHQRQEVIESKRAAMAH
jgi:hypothetical protein